MFYVVRRTILIAFYVQFYNDPFVRAVVLGVTCVFIAAVHIAFEPFKDYWDNIAESLSLSCLVVLGLVEGSQYAATSSAADLFVVVFIVSPFLGFRSLFCIADVHLVTFCF